MCIRDSAWLGRRRHRDRHPGRWSAGRCADQPVRLADDVRHFRRGQRHPAFGLCGGAAAKPPVPTGGALRLSQSVWTARFRTMYLAMVVMGMPLFHVLVLLVPFARSEGIGGGAAGLLIGCLLYTSPSP